MMWLLKNKYREFKPNHSHVITDLGLSGCLFVCLFVCFLANANFAEQAIFLRKCHFKTYHTTGKLANWQNLFTTKMLKRWRSFSVLMLAVLKLFRNCVVCKLYYICLSYEKYVNCMRSMLIVWEECLYVNCMRNVKWGCVLTVLEVCLCLNCIRGVYLC